MRKAAALLAALALVLAPRSAHAQLLLGGLGGLGGLGAPGAAGPPLALPGSAVVEPGVRYALSRFRTSGGLDLPECSQLCSVDVGCVAWVWTRLLRTCYVGYAVSGLPPLRGFPNDVVSGRPEQIMALENIDCVVRADQGVEYAARLGRQRTVGGVKTVGACSVRCAEAPGCVAFTWIRSLQLCNLKTALTGGSLPNGAAISGIAGPCTGDLDGAGYGGPPPPADYAPRGVTAAPRAPAPLPPGLPPIQLPPPGARGAGADDLQYGPPPVQPQQQQQQQRQPQQPPQQQQQQQQPGNNNGRPVVPIQQQQQGQQGRSSSGSSGPATTTTGPQRAAECRSLTFDAALDAAMRDVEGVARQSPRRETRDFGVALASRRDAVRARARDALAGANPGDRGALRLAVEGAVQAAVPGSLAGAVEVDGAPPRTFPEAVWAALEASPYVAKGCY